MPKDGSELRLDGQGKPLWLLLELTYRCPLQCSWCSNPLDFADYRPHELATEEWKTVLRRGRELGALQLGFSGGEPAVRRDLEELVAEADGLGYYTNLITSGMGLTPARLETLQEAGLRQIQLSLQHPDRAQNDSLVGSRSLEHKLAILKAIKHLGFPVVLNVPVSRQNIDATEEILELAEAHGVEFLELANIQYYNWAYLNRSALLPSREQLRRAEAAVERARERLGSRMTIYFVIPDYFDGRPKACMNGWGTIHLTIAPDGVALPCQQARVLPGLEFPSVRKRDLGWIWHQSPAFNAFRGTEWMKEPCRSCEERDHDFSGCRCQAYLLTGDPANPDPACTKAPDHRLVREAAEKAAPATEKAGELIMRRPGAADPGPEAD